MVPSDASEAIADLKSILRNLATGAVILVDPAQPAAEDAA